MPHHILSTYDEILVIEVPVIAMSKDRKVLRQCYQD